MYPYIVCFCGREIGCLYEAYLEMCKDLYVSEFGDMVIDPALISLTQEFQINTGEILTSLGLKLECCRARIMTQEEFKKLY
jgi:DNA-directed RNA polymerase subunit N (RpoN/RPB10)